MVMNEQELKDAISDMQECRELIGKANMKLNNILTQRKADMQKKLDDAYDRGYKKCLSEHEFDMPCSICDDYERGLNDAWDAAKKLAMMDTETSEEATGYFGLFRIMENLTPEEAISKLSAYEKEQKNKIHVGDEIKQVTDSGKETGLVCIVTYISGDGMNGIQHNGRMVLCSSQVGRWWKKTGRRFDIKAILEGMQE